MERVAVEKYLIYGCLHTPYQDPKAREALLDFVTYWKPDVIIENGDIHDILALSRHSKSPERALHLQDEVDEGIIENERIRKAAGKKTRIIRNQGNHDARWDIYLREQAPELSGLRDLQYEQVFKLAENDIQYNRAADGRYARLIVGPVQIGHHEIARKHSGWSAKALVEDSFQSVITNHQHRLGTFHKTTPNGQVVGHEAGCLCDLHPDYVEFPNWQQGFCIMQKVVGKPRYYIDSIPIVGGNILFDGRLF